MDLLRFSEAALEFEKPEEVFAATGRILDKDPDNAEALSFNGTAYYQTGNHVKAFENYSKAIDMGTDAPNPWIGLAELYVKETNHRSALETLRNGLAALPENPLVKQKLAELLMNTGSATEALPLLIGLAEKTHDVQVKILQAEAMKTLGLTEYSTFIKTSLFSIPGQL